ncbi:MAG TPA: hypothetical protein V6C81_07575 [Planktothrix sp.]|jgi:hypothetical protein
MHKTIARLAAFSYLMMFPVIGLLVAYIGLCDPDTCWHLALGRWMFEHHALPHVDPYSSNISSYVFVNSSLPLMQHEWLSDLFFYSIYSLGGLTGLLVTTAALSCVSLVFLPTRVMLRYRTPRAVIILAVSLTVYASSFRLWVRPESLSFVCMSLLIYLNELARTAKVRNFTIICALFFILFTVWCNLHIVFIAGIGYLLTYYLIGIVQAKAAGRKLPNLARVGMLISASLAGTFVNPWNVHLWLYVCKLLHSPITHMNKENGHMMLSDIKHPTFIPLVALYVLFWVIGWAALRERGSGARSHLFPFMLSGVSTLIVVLFRRLTPLALLMKLTGISRFYEPRSGHADMSYVYETPLEENLRRHHVPGGPAINWLGLGFAVLTCTGATLWLVPPQLPAPSRLFDPPYRAMDFLQQKCPAGRMFNDSKFGSMLTWYFVKPPDIFVDGRFDSFDRPLIYDYNDMRLCKSGWQSLLRKYDIGWVFFPPEAPLIRALELTSGWKEIYKDDAAAIVVRTED